MGSAGRTIPPSRARLAAAARTGRFARSPLLTGGAVLLAVGLVLRLDAARLVGGAVELVRDGIDAAVNARVDPGEAVRTALAAGARSIAPLLIAAAAAALLAALVPALLARRGGSTSVPLPDEPRQRPRRALLGAVASVVVVLVVLGGLATLVPSLGGLARGAPDAPRAIVEHLAAAVAAAGAVLVLAGLGDLALERTRLLRELAVTRSEQAREQRSLGGAGRARLRRLVRREPER